MNWPFSSYWIFRGLGLRKQFIVLAFLQFCTLLKARDSSLWEFWIGYSYLKVFWIVAMTSSESLLLVIASSSSSEKDVLLTFCWQVLSMHASAFFLLIASLCLEIF